MRKPGAAPLSSSPAPFLTVDQREALDAALAAKKEEASKANKAHHSKAKEGGTGERKPRNTKGTGGVKKAGGGGKFTWGNLLTDVYGTAALDSHDPNYDSDEERQVVYTTRQDKFKADIQAYKQQLLTVVEEYFSSADTANVVEELVELQLDESAFYFIKSLVRVAVDRKDREREMASALLSSLYGEVISAEQMVKGFTALVDSVEDLRLDAPNAVEMIATFVARAVVDEILPPSFVARLPAAEGSAAAEVKRKADSALSARHSAERLQRCWGTDVHASYSELKSAITKLLAEYTVSHDAEEAARCLHALAAPFFHHELVKQAVNISMDKTAQMTPLLELLGKLVSSGEISPGQLEAGFSRVRDNLGDTSLDCPNAPQVFAQLVETAVAAKLLPESYRVTDNSSLPPAPPTNGHHTHSVAAFKAAATTAVREYFASQDAGEVRRRLEELEEPGLLHLLVQHAVLLAMDRKDRERELVSTLLVELHPTPLSTEQLAGGIMRLLVAAEDVVLDHPDAVNCLALFLGRTIVDETLPPSFLTTCLSGLQPHSLGVAVVQQAGVMLSSRHAAERLQNCWHGGGLSLELLRGRMKDALLEYCTSKDADEAAKCLLELGVPHFHHEAVKTAVELCFESPPRQPLLEELLTRLAASGAVSQTQLRMGVDRVRSRLDDYELDYPHAREQLAGLEKAGETKGWLLPVDSPV